MGSVWIAEHLTLHTNVVVKFMAVDIAATADGAARFAREASAAAAVKSPHVVQVFDHGVTPDGDAYIVMELLEGRNLATYLEAHGPMSLREAATVIAQVAKALGRAHQVGVVHRDIKPDNVFLCDVEGGELFVKLLDFGIAKRDEHAVKSAATTTGAVVGTPYYMSPEQIVGDKDIDARTDIWSLGVVAYEAMTGRRPFEGATVGAITLAIHTATRRVSEFLPTAPPAVDEWFSRACARDPKERFQTARDLAQALLLAVGEVTGSVPMMRAVMPSVADDGGPASGRSSAEVPSDNRAATHLSSSFQVPPRASRGRPALVAGAVAAVVLAAVAVFAVVPRLRTGPRGVEATPPPSAAASTPSAAASDGEPTGALPAASASGATPVASTSAARPPAVVGSRGPSGAGPGVTGRPAVRPPPGKPKPGRTRDDDDIK
jgi:serine/threonine-protein kinase